MNIPYLRMTKTIYNLPVHVSQSVVWDLQGEALSELINWSDLLSVYQWNAT